jgi:DNA-binding LytR/AlgR family response regulator
MLPVKMTTAVICDDEPLLREHLREKLASLWPALQIVGEASNGHDAASIIATLSPDIAFLDIKMPGQTGIEVAQGIETDTRVVFVTAYDQYAVDAFENEAIDYVLKPAADARLKQTVMRLQKSLADHTPSPDISQILDLLARAAGGTGSSSPGNNGATQKLRWIRANRGDTTYQIAVDEVLFFQSDDKYTVVNTINGEHLISRPLSELILTLDREHFWQIHRGVVINVRNVISTKRDGDGRMTVRLKGCEKPLPVSRAYQHLFRQM